MHFVYNITYNISIKENLNMSRKYFIFEWNFIYFQIKLNKYKGGKKLWQGGKKIMTGWKENYDRVGKKLQ